jgi:hypothetical protein
VLLEMRGAGSSGMTIDELHHAGMKSGDIKELIDAGWKSWSDARYADEQEV